MSKEWVNEVIDALDHSIPYFEELLRYLKNLRTKLEELRLTESGKQSTSGEGMEYKGSTPSPPTMTYTFKMPNNGAMNRGPLAWLRRKLEEEERKGHIKLKRSYDGDKVVFEIELIHEACKPKIDRWAEWVAKRVR